MSRQHSIPLPLPTVTAQRLVEHCAHSPRAHQLCGAFAPLPLVLLLLPLLLCVYHLSLTECVHLQGAVPAHIHRVFLRGQGQ